MNHHKQDNHILLGAWSIAVVVFLFSLWFFFAFRPVTVSFLDVGQGDACLIQAGQNGRVFIDGGDTDCGGTLFDYCNLRNVTTLDAVFISHFHEDHTKGIEELLEMDFPVKSIYYAANHGAAGQDDPLLLLAEQRDIPTIPLQPGETVTLGKATYTALWPDSNTDSDNQNNHSLVLRMDYGESSVLFTGDIETGAAKALVKHSAEHLNTDVIKIPHHGGVSSISVPLMEACGASIGVISVGADNQYREPSNTMLSLLRNQNMELFRIDRDGTVVITLGKDGIRNVVYGPVPQTLP